MTRTTTRSALIALSLIFVLMLPRAVPAHADNPAWQPITSANAATLQPIGMVGKGDLYSVAYSPDTDELLVGARHGLHVYDAADLDAPAELFAEGMEYTQYFRVTPDRKHLLLANRGVIGLWDLETRELIRTYEAEGFYGSGQFEISPNGDLLARWSYSDGEVSIWDVQSGELVSQMKIDMGGGDLTFFLFSADSSSFLALSGYGIGSRWDVQKAEKIEDIEPLSLENAQSQFVSVVASPDGSMIAVIPRYTDNDTVRILDMETFESLHTIRVDGADIGSVGFSPDNRALIIDDESSYTIQVVDIESGDVTSRMEGHSDSITAFALTEDRLFTASRDLTVRMWDAETGSELDTLRQFTDSDPQIDVSNEYVALTNYGDSSIQLWRINAGENGDGVGTEIGHEVEKTLLGHTDYIFDLGFSADGSRLVTSSSDSTVRVWDVSTGETLFVLEHPDDVYGAGLNSDGSLIATGATDNLVRLWDGETGELITELEGHVSAVNRVVFSPDDKYLLSTGTDTYVYLWDLATNEAVLEERGADGEILAAAFNRDGSQFVTGGADMKLRIWNTAEGDYEPVLRGHTDVIWAAAFSADGALLASSGDDDTLRLWDVASHKMIAQIKPGVFGNIGSIGFNGDSTRLFASVSGSGVFVYATSEVGEPLPSSTLEFSDPYPVEGLKVESTETLDVPYIGAVLSPDGERFVLIGEDSLCVYTVENTADELAPQQCTTIEYAISPQSVRWSPDSTQIAYTESFRPDFIEQDIWVLNAETGEARNLTDDGAAGEVTMSNMANVNYDAFPTWSADGQLYFVRFVQGIGDVYTIDPNEPEGEPQYVGITNTSSFEFSGMIWTPHGLVFSSLRPPYGAELTATVWLMDLGDEVGELTPLSMAGESYVSEVSADGNFVLVLNTSVSAGGTPSATTTTIVAVDGSMEIPADKDARAQVGMWSPEGAGLLYLTSTNLYGIGAPGADSVEIERGNYTSPLHAARAPIWAANNVILLRDAVEGTLVVVRLEGE